MVQIIEEHRRPSTGQQVAKGLTQALMSGLQIYGQHQKNKADEQEYQRENETYKQLTGRNLSKNPKIREMEIEYALKGENQFQKENLKYKSKSEETAAKLAGEQKVQKESFKFADKLEENNPDSPLHKTIADIYRTELPMDQKSQIIKSLIGIDPFKVEQQKRLQLDSVLKRYNSRLKELDEEIKNVRNPNSTGAAELADLRKKRMSLRSERDQLLDFKSLNGMDDDEEFEEDEAIEQDEDEGPKVTFDANNKGHRAAAEKLYKKYKDKEKVRSILRKNFKGV